MNFIKLAKENINYLLNSNQRVGYVGWIGHGNLGDEAMYLAIRSIFPELNMLPFKYSKKIKFLEHIKRKKTYDAIVLGGGTLINAKGSLNLFRCAQSTCSKFFVFGAGVEDPEFQAFKDPDGNCINGWVDVLKKCQFVGVRGPMSKNILDKNGFNSSEVIGDPALLLAKNAIKKKKRRKKIAINIGISNGKVWGSEDKVLDFIVSTVKRLISKGWEVSFLPVWSCDLSYINEATKRIGSEINIFREFYSAEKVMNFLEECDIFIGEKLHSVILATCVYTPSLMLEYRPKCLDFMSSIGLERFSVRTDFLNEETCLNLIDELYENIECIQKDIFNRIHNFKIIQIEKSKLIKKIIL
jgi:polysaccharide pyruvyl transferase WcaK-like protein